jgi:hypothetical protein
MDVVIYLFVHLLLAIFVAGVAGCLIAIPVVAIKFGSVLVEPSHPNDAVERASE